MQLNYNLKIKEVFIAFTVWLSFIDTLFSCLIICSLTKHSFGFCFCDTNVSLLKKTCRNSGIVSPAQEPTGNLLLFKIIIYNILFSHLYLWLSVFSVFFKCTSIFLILIFLFFCEISVQLIFLLYQYLTFSNITHINICIY